MEKKTDFKGKVYKVVKEIPRRRVMTYKQVAELARRSRAWRAAGNLLNKNINPKIPCHRVIRSDGRIGGYRGGPKKKIALLKDEGITIKNGKIAFWLTK